MTDRKKILLLARTGLIIRNLLLGPFGTEVERHSALVAAVPDPMEPMLKEQLREREVDLVKFHIAPEGCSSRLGQLRSAQTYMYRFRQAEKSTRSVEIQTRLFESAHSSVGGTFRSSLLGLGRFLHSSGLLGPVEDLYLRSAQRWPVTRQWRETLRRLEPSAVLSTTLTLSSLRKASDDLPAVVAAHELGIPCGTLVQSWDNLSSKTAVLPKWLDRYWTWSEAMTAELLELTPRLQPEHVTVVGSPHFDFHVHLRGEMHREELLPEMGLNPEHPFVLVGTGTDNWAPNEPQATLALVDLLKENFPGLQVLLRLHPKDDGKRWQPINGRLQDRGVQIDMTAPVTRHMDEGGFTPPPDFYRRQISVLEQAAVVINTASTLTVDAALLNRPVISLAFDLVTDSKFPEGRAAAFNASTHFAPLVGLGGVVAARSPEELVFAIRSYLHDPTLHEAGRRSIGAYVAGPVDGDAGRRLAQEVLSLAGAASPAGGAKRQNGK